ncbi:substrate-binding periplasmic protein [Pseudoalteromonas sp. GB56]
MLSRYLYFFLVIVLLSASVKAHERVRIVTEPFPPYFAPELPQNGWLAHVVHEAFSLEDIDTSVDFTLWTRALKNSKRYKNVGLLGSYKTPSRVGSYYFSCEIATTATGLYHHRNSHTNFTGNLALLENNIIVTGRGYAIDTQTLKKLKTKVLEVPEISKALELLANRRVDWVLGAKEVTDFYIKQSDYGDLLLFDPPEIEKNSLHLAFSRNFKENQALLRHFHLGLKTLISSGRINEILSLHGMDELQQQEYIQRLQQTLYESGNCDGLPE